MHRPTLNQPVDLWRVDGSLRDVYVFNTADADWDSFLLLAQKYPHEYTRDSVALPLPSAAALFQDREHPHLLSVRAGSVRIHCHFFVSEEIELNVSPREIKGEIEHLAVLQFLEKLAQATQKDIAVTPENSPEVPLLQYNHASQLWRVHELHASGEA